MGKSDKELTDEILAAKVALNKAIVAAGKEGLEVRVTPLAPIGHGFENEVHVVDVVVLRHLC